MRQVPCDLLVGQKKSRESASFGSPPRTTKNSAPSTHLFLSVLWAWLCKPYLFCHNFATSLHAFSLIASLAVRCRQSESKLSPRCLRSQHQLRHPPPPRPPAPIDTLRVLEHTSPSKTATPVGCLSNPRTSPAGRSSTDHPARLVRLGKAQPPPPPPGI